MKEDDELKCCSTRAKRNFDMNFIWCLEILFIIYFIEFPFNIKAEAHSKLYFIEKKIELD